MNLDELLVEIKKVRELTSVQVAEGDWWKDAVVQADFLLERLEKRLVEEKAVLTRLSDTEEQRRLEIEKALAEYEESEVILEQLNLTTGEGKEK